ncbi:YqaA family protein [Halorarius halobius]|uniref:YqaA family protein n=1 Tax=Halorarius halobius TaxID=2962671 RepID=UPI0020CDB4DD|nr:VTT domain-containing protein [Halorarius halobius]
MTPLEVLPLFSWPDYHVLEEAVRTASGPLGLLIIAIYSFLIAWILPGPSEVVLLPSLRLGVPYAVEVTLIILVSGTAKAAGSVFAFAIGHEVKESGPVIRALRRSPVDIVEYSERKTIEIARKYGYAGLAMALCVPFFPDTLSIYAFSILEENYTKFAAATFVGSVGRLLVTLGLFAIGASIV